MNLNKLAKQIHENAVNKGFYDEPKEIGTLLMLIVSELGEALEADMENNYCGNNNLETHLFHGEQIFVEYYKKKIKGSFEEEIADSIIRILDLCAYKGIDIQKHVELKMRYNLTRPNKHGKSY